MSHDLKSGTWHLSKPTYVPVCASCTKVRDDAGSWRRSLLAFTRPADVLLTHGICPDCARTMLEEIDAF